MNDKVKGLVLGLSLGVMLTGSVAFANGAGTQIEVYFKNLKYMFDGTEKSPTAEQGQGFVYNGTTYVPLRFVSEALGKEVQWDGDTDTIWVGKKVDLSAVIATYQGGQVTLGEYQKFVSVLGLVYPSYAQHENEAEYKKFVIDQLVGYRLSAARLTEDERNSLPALVDNQINAVKKNVETDGQTLSSLLGKSGLTEADYRSYLELAMGSDLWFKGQVTDEKAKAVYDQKVSSKDESLIRASVRHILIQLKDDKGNTRTQEELDKKVKEIQDKLKNGEDFAALAKQYSEDPGSKDNGGLYTNAAVTDWVEPFKKAAIELELNKISDPVKTDYGYHIMRVESRSNVSFEDSKAEIAANLKTELVQKFMSTEVPSLMTKVDLPK
ncbi:peptidylprolyl isomerase [Paenibacillus rigui]|uniref:Peptidylprolyl isomerase n=1 Tax=Paenibacillus rigui TaxID=554312 RepID=A0A229UXU2_9BACL|nr:peptidylprolyl isomerase [Paenibacillus rigui]OXM88274.1 peptidylprolyl isomerase [Paenibacillus rigui]